MIQTLSDVDFIKISVWFKKELLKVGMFLSL